VLEGVGDQLGGDKRDVIDEVAGSPGDRLTLDERSRHPYGCWLGIQHELGAFRTDV
jgi:hypothetical protein